MSVSGPSGSAAAEPYDVRGLPARARHGEESGGSAADGSGRSHGVPAPRGSLPRQRRDPAAEGVEPVPAAPRDAPGDAPGDAERARESGETLTLLVVGADPADAFTVEQALVASGTRVRIRRARNMTEVARLLTPDVNCVLLDLDLPGQEDTDPLHEVLRLAPRTAVLAVTAEADTGRGAEAVRTGAQDYLVRAELGGSWLTRAIRYAVERKRADISHRQLAESRLRARENARLERGLLPNPLLRGSGLRFASRYRPGRSRALLGGDFYDAVRSPDGTVHAMIGDVCGHGPDEAALGVELRIAWRALTFAGLTGEALLSTLEEVLVAERADDEIFATLCTVDIAPDGRRADLYLAGHPVPLASRGGSTPELLPYEEGGPAMGLLPGGRWPRQVVELGEMWTLMLYTDGLIEGRVGEGSRRLGQEGMLGLITEGFAAGARGQELLDQVLTRVQRLNGGELTDDVAVVLLSRY
jgi:serine phosphatase RsbU (regulator of sigma subunit)